MHNAATNMSIEDQLEGEALTSNQQLLDFAVRSRNVDWSQFVEPLKPRTGTPLYLERHFLQMNRFGVAAPLQQNRREVLLCHDMMGNYGEDRFFRSSKKFDDYRFYHWSGIDYFCYFSHRYITIPPSGWITAAHKHGVRVLGTYIVEGFNGSRLLQECLQSEQMLNRIVAALLRLTLHFKFEGWLLNIECRVQPEFMENLGRFIDRLRAALQSHVPFGCVFWYDSLLETGEMVWQNELNTRNVRFLQLADAMLLNYAWSEGSLTHSLQTCAKQQLQPARVFAGIDVFGRGQVAKFQSRQTLARALAASSGKLSVFFFAPAWSFETLSAFGYDIAQRQGDAAVNAAFLLRNDKFWWSLWDQLAVHPYCLLPFYTDFCLGSGQYQHTFGKRHKADAAVNHAYGRFFNLARQSLQPSVPLHEHVERCYEQAFNGGSCLRLLRYDSSFRLFLTDFGITQRGLVCAYAFKLEQRNGEFDCMLRISGAYDDKDCYLFLGDYNHSRHLQPGRCYLSPFQPKYQQLLTGALDCHRIPKHLQGVGEHATNASESNGWRVRYYLMSFDCLVRVKDVGVLYRRLQGATDTAYLGALYINEFSAQRTTAFPEDSNYTHLPVAADGLLV